MKSFWNSAYFKHILSYLTQYSILYSVNFSSVYHRFIKEEHRTQEPSHHYRNQLKGFHAFPIYVHSTAWLAFVNSMVQATLLPKFLRWTPLTSRWHPHSTFLAQEILMIWSYPIFLLVPTLTPTPQNMSMLKFQWPENTTTVSAVEILAETL